MTPRLHDEAERELREAFEYFERQREGLGDEFVHAVDEAIEKVCRHPERWPVLSGQVRRCQTNKFKYGVLYHVQGDVVEILAVMDLRRRPGYWRKRLQD